jgi:hypothetical protein
MENKINILKYTGDISVIPFLSLIGSRPLFQKLVDLPIAGLGALWGHGASL